MLGYYLRLAWLGLRRTPAISALMVAAIGLGIGATTTTLTVHHLMSANPIAARNAVLRAVTIDGWDPNHPWEERRPWLPPPELTWRDATAIAAAHVADRAVVMRKTAFTLEPEPGKKPFLVEARLTTREFFPMFAVPFAYGGGWDERADAAGEPVVVLSRRTNERAFGGIDSTGRHLRLDSRDYRIAGVLGEWTPTPKFYDLNNGDFDDAEDVFVPLALGQQLELTPTGNTNCWKPEVLNAVRDLYGSECIWHQLWVEVGDPGKAARFAEYLDGYVRTQQSLGRLPRRLNNQLYTPAAWLERFEVVGRDSRILLWLSVAFLSVCVLNVVGLLLSRFLGAAGATALRRALGASRGDVFRQHLVEAGLVGALAGLLGLVLGWAGLRGMRALNSSFDRLTHLDTAMVGAAIALAVLAALLAGLYPAWRVCRVQPATYLKTQ